MFNMPNFDVFGDDDKTWYNAYYLEDQTIGGGSVMDEFFYYGPNHEVKSPGPQELRNVINRGVDALESGKTAVGGYYYIKNIQKKNPNS